MADLSDAVLLDLELMARTALASECAAHQAEHAQTARLATSVMHDFWGHVLALVEEVQRRRELPRIGQDAGLLHGPVGPMTGTRALLEGEQEQRPSPVRLLLTTPPRHSLMTGVAEPEPNK
jgi:hypothetical protein